MLAVSILLFSLVNFHAAQAACPVAPAFIRNGTITEDWDVGSYPVARFLSPPDRDYTVVFRAPVGKRVQVRVTLMFGGEDCDATCSRQGLILKTGDPNMPEKRICCQRDFHTVYTSVSNTFTLVSYNCEAKPTTNTNFMLESRYVSDAWTAPAKIAPPAPRSQCGALVTGTTEWQKSTYVMDKNGEPENEGNPRKCSFIVKCPAGKKVRVRVVAHDLLCGCGGPECDKKGMELKLRNPAVKDPIICCKKDNFKIFTSPTNMMPVSAWNNVAELYYFTIEHRCVDKIDEKEEEKPINPKCVDSMEREVCESMKNGDNFCANPEFEFRDIKMSCARTCELCGKKAENCADQMTKEGCTAMKEKGDCTAFPIDSEYWCAETCGYCANPL